MADTRRAVRPPIIPDIVLAEPTWWRSGPWWVAVLEGAGAWVWQPGGTPTWVDGAESADEALDALRQPLTTAPGSRARDSGDETKAARVRASDRVGQAPDTVVAAELGVSRRLVYEERMRRGGAPPPAAPSAERQRTDQLVREAWGQGLRRDVDIAHMAGLSEAAVWTAKRRLGLEAGRKRRWTPEDLAQVASYPTTQAAADAMGLTLAQAKAARRRAGSPR